MRTTQAGQDLIKLYEGLRLTAYRCPAGILTIGYGHTGVDVTEGRTITADIAEALFVADLTDKEASVAAMLDGILATDNQFSALVSFAYNLGERALHGSTLLRDLLAGDTAAAADEFGRWIYGGGKILDGLVLRRAAERKLFLAPDGAPNA